MAKSKGNTKDINKAMAEQPKKATVVEKMASALKAPNVVVTTNKQEKNAVVPAPKAAAPRANVGDPFLGMGVEFYPSEYTRELCHIADGSKGLEGEIVLVIGDGVVKVKVEELAPRVFVCKASNDSTLNKLIDNSWK